MTYRERFLATVLGRPPGRVPHWHYWWVWQANLDHHIPPDVSWGNFCHYATGLTGMGGGGEFTGSADFSGR